MIDHLSGSLEDVTTVRLREIAAYMREWLPKIEARLRSEDEKELADARAKVAEIEARMGAPKTVLLGAAALNTADAVATTQLKGKPSEYEGTDFGQNVGIDPVQRDENLIDELAQLKAHNDEKRARLRARGRQ